MTPPTQQGNPESFVPTETASGIRFDHDLNTRDEAAARVQKHLSIFISYRHAETPAFKQDLKTTVMLTGLPGSGKSATLRYIYYSGFTGAEHVLPVWVDLKGFSHGRSREPDEQFLYTDFARSYFDATTQQLEARKRPTPATELAKWAAQTGAAAEHDAPPPERLGYWMREFTWAIDQELTPAIFLDQWGIQSGQAWQRELKQQIYQQFYHWLSVELFAPLTRSARAFFVINEHEPVRGELQQAVLRSATTVIPLTHATLEPRASRMPEPSRAMRSLLEYRKHFKSSADQSGYREVAEDIGLLDRLAALRSLEPEVLMNYLPASDPQDINSTPENPTSLRKFVQNLKRDRYATWDPWRKQTTLDSSLRTLVFKYWLGSQDAECKQTYVEWQRHAVRTYARLLLDYPQNIVRYAREIVYHLAVLAYLGQTVDDLVRELPPRPHSTSSQGRKALIKHLCEDHDIEMLLGTAGQQGGQHDTLVNWVDAMLRQPTPEPTTEEHPEPAC